MEIHFNNFPILRSVKQYRFNDTVIKIELFHILKSDDHHTGFGLAKPLNPNEIMRKIMSIKLNSTL